MLPTPDGSTRAPTILIVDDDDQNRRLFDAMLRPAGYRTRMAGSGEEALASIEGESPDLILLDVKLPGMDGFQVARTLKENPATSAIPIIMVTGENERNVRLSGLEAGAEDFVSKPVDRAELWLRVRNLLRLKTMGDLLQNHRMLLEEQVQQRTAALQSSLKEREVLLKEVHHRVKNNMQIITSLLRMEFSRTDKDETRRALKDMQHRILAMAGVHEILYRSGNFSEIDLGAYLTQLVGQLRKSLSGSGHVAFRLDVASPTVGLDQAAPCGLIVTELVTNSLKHGFPHGRFGEVRVELLVPAEERLLLRVSDDGIGVTADLQAERHKSLGLSLVSDLARQLGGELRISPGPPAVFEVNIVLRGANP